MCSLTPSCGNTGGIVVAALAVLLQMDMKTSRPLFVPVCACIVLQSFVLHTCACRPRLTVHWADESDHFQWAKQDYFTVWITFNWHTGMSLWMEFKKTCKIFLLGNIICTSMLFTVLLNVRLASLICCIVTVQWFVSCNTLLVGEATRFWRSKMQSTDRIVLQDVSRAKVNV